MIEAGTVGHLYWSGLQGVVTTLCPHCPHCPRHTCPQLGEGRQGIRAAGSEIQQTATGVDDCLDVLFSRVTFNNQIGRQVGTIANGAVLIWTTSVN